MVVNGSMSKTSEVFPQGTVLNPIIFLVHIKDILDTLSADIRLFADGCVCCREINDLNDCQILQEDLNKLGNWADAYGTCDFKQFSFGNAHHQSLQ